MSTLTYEDAMFILFGAAASATVILYASPTTAISKYIAGVTCSMALAGIFCASKAISKQDLEDE